MICIIFSFVNHIIHKKRKNPLPVRPACASKPSTSFIELRRTRWRSRECSSEARVYRRLASGFTLRYKLARPIHSGRALDYSVNGFTFTLRYSPQVVNSGRSDLYKTSGFTIIELLITLLITSMLAGILFTSFQQIRLFLPAVDRSVDTGFKAGILASQLEKDLLGAHVPVEVLSLLAQKLSDKNNKPQEGKKDSAVQGKDEQEEDSKKKKKRKMLEKIFVSSNQGENLNELTFITNNPLQKYPSSKPGSSVPRVVRVTYALRQEKESDSKRTSYQLVRKESMVLDEKGGKESKEFVVIDGIKSLSVEYSALKKTVKEEKPEGKPAPQGPGAKVEPQAPPKKKIIYELVQNKEWEADLEKEGNDPALPKEVTWKLSLWDAQKKRTRNFTFGCSIPFMPVIHMPPPKPPAKKPGDRDKELPGVFKKIIKGATVPPELQGQVGAGAPPAQGAGKPATPPNGLPPRPGAR